ncbi:glycerophosphoryl diester phosphodiesterase [Arcanobacterium pluranimalium]|uniref:glycerophosphodiester phosphodiesterase n=1 Tax=Arcanobacterium pluranimalium TaxID=108028 RepID=UPI001957FF72|nr:glycerophosphodiester phosphodiesterase family protein [Arcanobacterium pluranimalium]MBM7824280.1 glycerophosphoryl diester phosphodiesterase [Arcanobacterium pluranimalium]
MEQARLPQVIGTSKKFEGPLPPRFDSHFRERVIAHRGSSGLYPENTMMAFRHAWDGGCRVLETDIQVTSDGVVVCFHDATLDRITNLNGPIIGYTWEILATTAVVHGPNGWRDRILKLDDLLVAFPYAQFIIDIKNPAAIEPLIEVINRTRSAGRICVSHSWSAYLEDVRARTSPILQRTLGWENLAELIRCARLGLKPDPQLRVANWVHIPYDGVVSPLMRNPVFAERFMSMAHDLGIGVRVWSVNSFTAMNQFWNMGIDAVTTDYPERAIEMMVNREAQNKRGELLVCPVAPTPSASATHSSQSAGRASAQKHTTRANSVEMKRPSRRELRLAGHYRQS